MSSFPAYAILQLPQSTLRQAGDAARSIADLGSWVIVVFCIVAIVMFVLIAWIGLRRRGTLDYHAPIDIGGGHSWILIGGFFIPAVILGFVFVFGLKTLSGFPMRDGPLGRPDIRIVGHQWWWKIRYLAETPDKSVTTANEIHIPVGRFVDIDLGSTDVIHSFWVPALHGKVDRVPGVVNRIRIRADQAGSYRGQCAEFCGAQHANMALNVVAQNPDDYEAWLEHERQNASTPTDSEALHGKQIFVERPCALCHAVRGTPALGGVAPDLTHLAGRQRIATNLLPNNAANLGAWITHAQSLKPGVAMPNVTQFTGEELQAVVAYLSQLK